MPVLCAAHTPGGAWGGGWEVGLGGSRGKAKFVCLVLQFSREECLCFGFGWFGFGGKGGGPLLPPMQEQKRGANAAALRIGVSGGKSIGAANCHASSTI